MHAKKFIDMLEQQELLEADVLTELRRQVAESKTNVRPETIAKLLVENGQLTRFQASKLIASLQEDLGIVQEVARPSDELGLAMDSGEPEVLEVEEIVDEVVAEAIDDSEMLTEVALVSSSESSEVGASASSSRGLSKSSKSSKEAKPAKESSKKAKKEYIKPKKKRSAAVTKDGRSEWDVFRIYGFFGILCLLLVFLGFFGLWMWRGDESKLFKSCDDAYAAKDYDQALSQYRSFLARFPDTDNSSLARVRMVICEIRLKSERSGDPVAASQLSRELLPTVSEEKAIDTARPDLGSTLMMIAEKYNQRAERARTLDEKKSFLGGLGEHFLLLENPAYFGSQERKQNEARLNRIKEERDRIQREIQRTDDLNETIVKMKAAIEQKDVIQTYTLRKELVRKYVQLETDPELLALVSQATSLQQGLVGIAKELPQVVRDAQPMAGNAKAITIANQRVVGSGTGVKGVIAVWVKSAVYGLDASTGKVLWRRYMGRQSSIEPLRVTTSLESDILLIYPEQGWIQRLSATDGSQKWQIAFGGPIRTPIVDRDEIFLTTAAGGVFSIDSESGDMRWGRQVPQAIDVGPGIAPGKGMLFVLGDHSNLYLLDRKDGSCSEVFYLGHQTGSIKVSPVLCMGHVLVFDNAGPGFSFMRILRPDETGKNLKIVQESIRMGGHVVVKPLPEGRRLAVATDLREITIFDVEPSKDRDQVGRIAFRVANESSPKDIWPLVDKNELWVASENITRFEILVPKQQLDGKWIKEDQDRFTGAPIRLDKWVVHTRVLRGTMGVRVAAVDGVSGESVWETDLGVPLSLVESRDGKPPFYVVSSQAALFALDREAMSGQSTPTVMENAGRSERMLNFQSPVTLADGRTVLFNSSSGNQITISDATSSTPAGKLRRLTMALGKAVPNALPAAVGNNLAVPLNNGQLMLIDPGSGQMKAQPFQPTLQPGGVHEWIGPATLSDQSTVVIGDSTQRLYRISTNGPLRSLGDRVLERALRGHLVALGDTVIGYSRGPTGDFIDVFRGGDLQSIASPQLDGRVVWGPFVLENRAYLQSDADGLVAIDAEGKIVWKCPLPRMNLVGAPTKVGDDLLLGGAIGELIRVSNAGVMVAKSVIGEPISGTPLVIGENVVVPGDEGVALLIKAPTSNGAAQ